MPASGGSTYHGPGPDPGRTGVAILANDRVYDWLIAFLESFRQHNPDTALYVLPYDDRTAKVRALAGRYRFEFVDHDFAALDRFARRLYPLNPVRRRRVRKFGALDLDLDTVIYADIDAVILHDLSPLFGLLRPGETELIYASRSPGFVFRPGYRAVAGLENATEFSDGFFVTSRRFVSNQRLIDTVNANLATFRQVRQARVYTQPILNFVVHMAGVPVRAVSQVTPDLSDETYYKGEGITRRGERFLDKEGRQMLLMHWAGPTKLKDDAQFADLWQGHRRAHDAGEGAG
jgi:hypothetical protein